VIASQMISVHYAYGLAVVNGEAVLSVGFFD
jgi:hypothetical protein